MSAIFISHSSKDNAYAKELEERLTEQNHHSVFLDLDPEKGIVAGQSWERTLYRKLRSCQVVIALCTDDYLKSQWCFAEIALARMEEKHLFALLIDPLSKDAKLPSILTEKQFIDLRSKPEEGYERLWHGLREEDLLGVQGDWGPSNPPYLGLSTFQEKHAPVFFGRDDETFAGVELLSKGAPNLVMVLGASGSGKSSLVRAGILPRLRLRKEEWLIVDPFRPGTNPLKALAFALGKAFTHHTTSYAAKDANPGTIYKSLQIAIQEEGELNKTELEDQLKEETNETLEKSVPEPLDTITAEDVIEQEELANNNLLEEEETAPTVDERLQHIMEHLEEIKKTPSANRGRRLKKFLDWSLTDLKYICGQAPEKAILWKKTKTKKGNTIINQLTEDLRHYSKEGKSARVLIIIDQFEELLGHDNKGRPLARPFLKLLRKTLEAPGSRVKVLGTMRSDFLNHFQRNRELRGIDFGSLSLGPMKMEGIREIIEKPADLAAVELEEGLADQIMEDMKDSSALPLLSFTLWKLWQRHGQDKNIQISEYQQLGKLQGAISQEADAVLDLANRKGKKGALKRAFLKMARLTDDGKYARRSVSWEQKDVAKVKDLLKKLEEQRLLVNRTEGEENTVEVAHEALFNAWRPLRIWLNNHRSELLLRQQLKRDSESWEKSKEKSNDQLWRGGRLQQARELIARGYEASKEETLFIKKGWYHQQFRQRINFGIGALIMASMLMVTFWALRERDNAQEANIDKDEAIQLRQAAEDNLEELQKTLEDLQKANADIQVLKKDKEEVEEKLIEQNIDVKKDDATVLLSNIAEALEAQKLIYDQKSNQTASGIVKRILKEMQKQYPDALIPPTNDHLNSRSIAAFYEKQDRFQIINDAVANRDLIRPGSVMFYGRSGKTYSNLTIEQMNDIIFQAGVVTEVKRDANNRIIGYVLFQALRRGKTAQRSYYHNIEPPRLGYPSLGNWNQQWVGIAYPL